MKDPQPTSAKAAFMHQGQVRQPAPKPASAKAALMHRGQPRPPVHRLTSAKAAVLQRSSAQKTLANSSAATVTAGISFDTPIAVNTPQRITYTIRVNLKAELYDISQGSYPGLANAIESRFNQAVKQTHTPPKGAKSLQQIVFQFTPGEVSVTERNDYKNTAGKYEIVVIDQVLGSNSQDRNGAAGIADFYGSHLFVGKNRVTGMVSTIIHELGHSMGLQHTWEDAFPGNDRNPNNMMSYNRTTDATFSGEQLFQAFTKRSSFMQTRNYIVTPEDMNTLYGGSTNDRPVRTNTGRGVAIPAPINNPQD